MKLPAFLLILATSAAFGQAASQAPRHESLKQELRLGVERGLNFLRSKQNQQTGQWGEAEPVAITGLAMTAFMLDPNRKPGDPVPPKSKKPPATSSATPSPTAPSPSRPAPPTTPPSPSPRCC
jgi:squalene-hopene/tetraprenyl-beta-curcumene cyclase